MNEFGIYLNKLQFGKSLNSKDRETIIERMYHHVTNYGIVDDED